jgi:hypothetical protein
MNNLFNSGPPYHIFPAPPRCKFRPKSLSADTIAMKPAVLQLRDPKDDRSASKTIINVGTEKPPLFSSLVRATEQCSTPRSGNVVCARVIEYAWILTGEWCTLTQRRSRVHADHCFTKLNGFRDGLQTRRTWEVVPDDS